MSTWLLKTIQEANCLKTFMNERHLEFGMEGFRFFDVVRVGWGEKVFKRNQEGGIWS